jgi:hypothetical protein
MSTDGCFDLLDSDNLVKKISVAISVVFSVVIPPIVYSVVWFEKFGSGGKRTLINRLVAAVCWNGIVWSFTIQVPMF